VTIYWLCDNDNGRGNCFALSAVEKRPHKSFRRKRALLDNGKLDEDDELVVFSELYGKTLECENCGDVCRPVLSINRFDWDDPPGNGGDDEWLYEIADAVAVYKRNGWYPRLQRRLY